MPLIVNAPQPVKAFLLSRLDDEGGHLAPIDIRVVENVDTMIPRYYWFIEPLLPTDPGKRILNELKIG